MKLVSLRCKSCGASLKPENIVERLAMARCDHCGAVFGLEGFQSQESIPTAQAIERGKVPMPKGITVEGFGSELIIQRRWFGAAAIFLIIFALFWNGFMVVWHGISLSTGAWFMSVFGLIHTGVGVFVGYFALASIFNTTTIRISRGTVSVNHGPLPWPGNLTLDIHDVEQLYCKEKVSSNKNGTSYTYEVHMTTHNSGRKKLVSGLNDVDQALFIEQQIESHLEIEDRPVGGEVSR